MNSRWKQEQSTLSLKCAVPENIHTQKKSISWGRYGYFLELHNGENKTVN